MRSLLVLLAGAGLLLICGVAAAQLPGEPIAYVGHGAAFDRNGRELQITPAFIESAQAFYLRELPKRVPKDRQAEFERMRGGLAQMKSSDPQMRLYATSALIDWLLTRTDLDKTGSLAGKNNFLKVAIRSRVFPNRKFVPPEELTRMAVPVSRALHFSTLNSGAAYRTECATAGVPVPPDWGSAQWVQHGGDLSPLFISPGRRARVFIYHSTSPEGVCYALPRDNGSDIELLGIICMGKVSSNVCFWDNQQSDMSFNIPLGDSRPITDFAGGAELLGGSGGICTTCHSGENPYTIHPGSALDLSDIGVETMPDNWYDPLVHPNWPQNAGPLTTIPPAPPGQSECTSCHRQGSAGRFPMISTANNVASQGSYCTNVLQQALALTMPQGDVGSTDYDTQKNDLLGRCSGATQPVMRIESLVLDYGEVELGFGFTKAIVVHNDGDAPLSFTLGALVGADAGQWSEAAPAGMTTLNPGDPPASFRYTYTPQAIATHNATVQITGGGNATINLTGRGRTPIPIDTMLVMDRSGSMAEAIGERRKIDAMRDAANLYSDLLRDDVGGTGTGDKLGMIKYNDQNSVYLPFDFTTAARKTDIANNFLNTGALSDSSKLKPEGYTGIGGAMETAAFKFGGADPARRQVMIVLTDGVENREPWIENAVNDIRNTFPNMFMYSVGLGDQIEPTKLQMITNVSNGYHQVQANLTATTLFDLETFYFKIFAHATDMDLVLDPTYAVNITGPDPIEIARAGIISSDRSATFLVLDDPVLRQFYDLEFVSPQGTVIIPFTTIGGIPVQVSTRHTYRLYRIIFPDLSLQHTYVGEWIVRLKPNGKWRPGNVKKALGNSPIHYEGWLNPYTGLVPVGFVAAVSSDYKLKVALAPTSYLPGADVLLTAMLTDRGWPAPNGTINVTVSSEGGATHNVTLYDDGTHGDQTAGDATFSNHFVQTATPNVYKFLFRSTGHNERGEIGQREATRYVTLMQPEKPPSSRPCLPCWLEWLFFILILLFLLALLYCCFFRHRLAKG